MSLFQVVRFEIYHLDLGSQTENPCHKTNDVLAFSEILDEKISHHCVRNYLTEYTSLTNTVNVTFTTNAENDAQGFRLLYNAGKHRAYKWDC